MVDNFPDDVPAGSLRAPWNQPDPDPLVCGECGQENECDEDVGDPCTRWYNSITDKETGDEDPYGIQCPGKYESTRCDTCGHINCNCD